MHHVTTGFEMKVAGLCTGV